jgi:hypothetical protein
MLSNTNNGIMTVSDSTVLIQNNVILYQNPGVGIWVREPSLPIIKKNEVRENEI